MKKNKAMPFFTKTLGGMAYGLFATLIIGTIIGTLGSIFVGHDNGFCNFMVSILGSSNNADGGVALILKNLTGIGIGVGIALVMKFDALKTITLGVVGEIAALTTKTDKGIPTIGSFTIGDPLLIYLVCISVVLLFSLILKKKTSLDILIVPLLGVALGLAISLILYYPISYVTFGIRWLIEEGTNLMPFLMGIVVSLLMGMALTAPISSAAIGAILFTGAVSGSGLALASGAAVVGCSVQMVGFAVQTYRDNKIGDVISVGIGTSMLQFKNIVKKPVIWLPTMIVSAVLGPIATCVLHLECFGAASGMGTAGLVGQIGTFSSMGNTWQTYVGIFGLEIVAPIILVFLVDLLFRKVGWIKKGDFSLLKE